MSKFTLPDLQIVLDIVEAHTEMKQYLGLGRYHIQNNDPSKAIEYFLKSLAAIEKLGDEGGMMTVHYLLGFTYTINGQYQQAIEHSKKSLGIAVKRSDKEGVEQASTTLGNAYRSNGQHQMEIENYNKYLEIAEKMGDKKGVGIAYRNLGEAYDSISEYQRAIECHKKELEIAEELDDIEALHTAQRNLGCAYRSTGEYQMAIECYNKYLEISEKLGDKEGVGLVYRNLGEAYASIYQHQRAIECHEKELDIAKQFGDKEGVGIAYRNLGEAYASIYQHQRAIECHEKELEIAEELGYEEEVGIAYRKLGEAYKSIYQHQRAIECHNKYLEIAGKLGDKKGVGIAYSKLGETYESIHQHQRAIGCHTKHLEIAKELDDSQELYTAQQNLGFAYHSSGQYRIAIECHAKCLEIGGEEVACSFNINVGNVYISMGKYQMAIKCYTKALEIAEKIGDRNWMRAARENLGCAYNSIGQYQMAKECHAKTLENEKELGDRVEQGECYFNLGNVYLSIGQYEMAIECYTKQLEIAKEVGDKERLGKVLGNLGQLYRDIGRYEEAVDFFQRSLAIHCELNNKSGMLTAYGNLGASYHHMGKNQIAMDYYKKALENAGELGDEDSVTRVLSGLGDVYHSAGQYQMAIALHNEGLKIAEELGDIYFRACSQAYLGKDHQQNSPDRACQYFAKSILDFHTIRRKGIYQDEFNTSLSNKFAGVYRYLFPSLVNLNQVKAALLVSDSGKANALFDLIRKYVDVVVDTKLEDQQIALFREISADPSSKKNELLLDVHLSEIIRFKQDGSVVFYSFDPSNYLHIWVISGGGVFHELFQTSNGTSAKWFLNQNVKTVRESLSRAERECCIPYPENFSSSGKDESNPSEFANVRPMGEKERTFARDLQERILSIFTKRKPNHVLDHGRNPSVEKCVRERYHLDGASQSHSSSFYSVSTTKRTGETRKKLCEYYSLDIPSTTSLSPGRSPKTGTYTPTYVNLEKLYSILIAPIEQHLTGRKLLIVPDKALFLLPFCALLRQAKGHLCEKYSLQFTPALQVLNASLLKPLTKLGPALFVGNPTVGEVDFFGRPLTLELLPNATAEARECAKYFKAEPLLKGNATKAKVLTKMEDASIIHIAAHAHVYYADIFLAPNEGAPKPPSNEHYLLTAKDVLKCHLSARLVVLSCCHSGRGEISHEGVVGIARSFLGAGARSILVTLCRIPDEQTKEFMRLFYDKACQGISVCRALQETMIELKKKFSVAEWAPFQIVGEDIFLSKEDIDEIRRESSMSKSRKFFKS